MKIPRNIMAAVAFLMLANYSYAVEFGENSSEINHPYMNVDHLNFGATGVMSGYGTKAHIFASRTVLGIEIVDGVNCVKVLSMRTESGQQNIAGSFAQDMSGNVYLLKYFNTANSSDVVLGRKNAVLYLPKNVKVGDRIYGDKTVVEVGVTVPQLTTGLGPYTNCLKTVEDDGDIVYFAPDFGEIKTEYINEVGGYELVKVIRGTGPTKIDDSLMITIPCLMFKGTIVDIAVVLESYSNPEDPASLYWKLKEVSDNT